MTVIIRVRASFGGATTSAIDCDCDGDDEDGGLVLSAGGDFVGDEDEEVEDRDLLRTAGGGGAGISGLNSSSNAIGGEGERETIVRVRAR